MNWELFILMIENFIVSIETEMRDTIYFNFQENVLSKITKI